VIAIKRYDAEHKALWDSFIARSKNGVFLFHRDYMEYHSDRFKDCSRMFFEGETLVAVMPANVAGERLVSHGGLTFGGIVSDSRMKTPLILELFAALKEQLLSEGLTKLVYKAIPHIYHSLPAEEDLYALYRHGATLVRRDVASTLDARQRIGFSKGRKWSIKQALKHGLRVERSYDFDRFMAIEGQVLRAKYGVEPVHSGEEMRRLAGRFPENIKLFAAYKSEEMLAGVIIYESRMVAHAQYISADDEGKQAGALDLILNHLTNEYYAGKPYFDFGISTENNGSYLNEGLIENKESFGARAVVYDFYELSLTA
jgi:hypothetical protein